MKRVAILTFFNHRNYGAVLQSTALQHIINELGVEAELLDYRNEMLPSSSFLTKSKLKKLVSLLPNLRNYLISSKLRTGTEICYSKFLTTFQSVSKQKLYDAEDLKKISNDYNGFIAGSDMVWSPVINQDLDYFFMTFAPKDKRLSYAASLTGVNNFTPKQHREFKQYFDDMKFISCREREGVEYVNSLGLEATQCVDPTLLMSKNEWKDFLGIKDNTNKEPYLLCYMFDGDNDFITRQIYKFAKCNNLQIRYIPMNLKEMAHETQQGNLGVGPKEFVELFLNASFIVTNTFHGLMFSLISENPFVIIHREKGNRWKRNENRITDILELIGQENRYIQNNSYIEKKFIHIDYHTINKKIIKLRDNSFLYLRTMLECLPVNGEVYKVTANNVDDVGEKQCTGCECCVCSCPVSAITMKSDEEGFLKPHIDHLACCNCGKCVKVCHAITNNQNFRHTPEKAIAGYSSCDLLSKSASGGLFATAAKCIIENFNGVVYGVVLSPSNLECMFAEADTIEGVKAMQDSKYIQPKVGGIYTNVKARLEEGRVVLFTGSPCHIAALRSFLGRDYNNLYTIDIICHGVPSPMFWKKYVAEHQGITSARFRTRENRKKNISTLSLSLRFADGKIKVLHGPEDVFFGTYLRSEDLRISCYYCKYADLFRCGDITMGDFDSISQLPDFDLDESKSCILINSIQGEKLWKHIVGQFIYKEIDLSKEKNVNLALREPSNMPLKRYEIYHDLKNMTWKSFKYKYEFRPNKLKVFMLKLLKYIKVID